LNIKKIINIVTTILVSAIVVIAVLLVGLRLFGIQVYSVISGSMEPEYPTGSLIYVKSVEPSEVEVDDVITFALPNGTPATHRVISIDEENSRFYTRGDANFKIDPETGEKIYTEDPPVYFKNLIGKPILVIPYLGYVAYFIQHPPGTYIALALGAVILALAFIPDILSKGEDKKSSSEEENKENKES
jgi:signal peptidase